MDIKQLTPEMQAGAVPVTGPPNMTGAPSLAASPGTVTGAGQGLTTPPVPSPTNGLAGALQDALAKPANGIPLSFNDRLHDHTNEIAKSMPPQVPGGIMRAIVGGALTAIRGTQNAMSTIGEYQEAAAQRPGEGIFRQTNDVNAARQQKQQAQQKFQTEEDKDRAMIAQENASTIHQQMINHQLSDEVNHKDIQNGLDAIDMYTTNLSKYGLSPAPIIASHIADTQAHKAIQDGHFDTSYNHMWPDGSFQPMDPKTGKPMVDKDGEPMLQKTYTVLGNIPTTHLTPEMAKLIKDNLGHDFKEGQELSGALAGSLIQQAMTAQAVRDKRDFDLEKAGVEKGKLDIEKGQQESNKRLETDPSYQQLMSSGADLENIMKYVSGQQTTGQMVPEKGPDGKPTNKMVPEIDKGSSDFATAHPFMAQDIINHYNSQAPGGFEKVIEQHKKDKEEQRKQSEVERKNQADEDIKTQAENDKKAKEMEFKGDENATTPEAFLASLNSDEKSLVQAIGTGHMDVDRLGYLLSKSPTMLAAVEKAYPDFDNSKVKGYASAVKDYTSSKAGTAGGTLLAGSVALKHMKELYDLNTLESRIPGTKDYQRYENKVDTLADELAKFYGNTTIPAVEGYKSTLNATFNRGAAIQTQVGSMQDKFSSLQQTWDNAAPSDAYKRPMPNVDQTAKDAAAYVLSGGKDPNTQQKTPPKKPVPVGKTRILDSNGDYHDVLDVAGARKIDPKLQVVGQ